jgi:hypothetical protein
MSLAMQRMRGLLGLGVCTRRQQHPALFEGLTGGREEQCRRMTRIECGLGQHPVQLVGRYAQAIDRLVLVIGLVELSSREHIGAAQHVGRAGALDHEDFEALGTVAKEDDSGGVTGGVVMRSLLSCMGQMLARDRPTME